VFVINEGSVTSVSGIHNETELFIDIFCVGGFMFHCTRRTWGRRNNQPWWV